MKRKHFFQCGLFLGLVILLSLPVKSFSQQWGLYTLYATKNGTKAYLVDTANTPSTFHQWTFSSSKRSAYSAYLIPGDTLVRTYKPSGNTWSAGAITGGIQKVTWDGTVAWDFTYYSSSYSAHHDICPMPNGNVLLISYDVRSAAQATQAGSSSASTFWAEKIVEVKPTGPTTGTIVWEWYLWDHMCQNYNSGKDNYVTSIVNNPQLLNINYSGSGNLPDRYHMNGLDYNEELDQIAISMHYMNSIFVIDHSTTTAEAAGHTGGDAGMGGDFLYRWGNPASWGASGSTVFSTIHDAHWVSSDHPNYPNYLCGYNNRGGTGGKTAITIVSPPYNGNNYTVTPGQENPTSAAYQFTTAFSASNEGNSQQLPNGNMLVNNFQGSVYEVNAAGTELWTKTNAQSTHAYRYTKCYVRGPKASANISSGNICTGTQIALNSSAVSVTETSPTYTYNWTSTATGFTSTSQNPTDNPASSTTYIVTITNTAIGCTDTAEVSVIVSPGPTASVSTTNANCGSANGTATVTASGGSGTYTYLWGANAGNQTTQTATNLAAGTYNVTVDDGNCSTVATGIVIGIGAPTASVSTTNANCGSANGTATVTASGGSGTYTYLWGANAGNQTTQTATNLAAGTYNVTVDDGNCSTVATGIVIGIGAPTASVSTTNANCGSANGTATVTASGGSGTYTYLWGANAGNQTTQTATNLAAGTYNVTVDDGNCSTVATGIVIGIGAPTASVSTTNANCGNANGTATVTASGGSGTYTYLWGANAGNQTTQTATNLAAGTYSVTVSDGNCSTVATGIVIGIGAPTANVSTTNANCGSANGTTTVTASGGSGTYTYQWDANAGNQTTQTATNLPAGTYDVTVSDGNCSTIATGIVNETGAPTIVISQSNDNICEGQSVTLIASGADSYTWSPATGLNTTTGNTVIATPPYTITYTVEGSTAGCSAFESARIIVNPAATADFSYVENNLTVDFTNLSMNALTYNWDFGDGNSTNLINPSHSYAINGSYNVELTATNDCSSDTITLLVDLVTGINKIDADNNWSIYPNPTTGMIMFGKSLVYKVILTNLLGAVLETKINVDAMDLSGYPGGIYYLSFISENGSVSNHKIIILR